MCLAISYGASVAPKIDGSCEAVRPCAFEGLESNRFDPEAVDVCGFFSTLNCLWTVKLAK